MVYSGKCDLIRSSEKLFRSFSSVRAPSDRWRCSRCGSKMLFFCFPYFVEKRSDVLHNADDHYLFSSLLFGILLTEGRLQVFIFLFIEDYPSISNTRKNFKKFGMRDIPILNLKKKIDSID